VSDSVFRANRAYEVVPFDRLAARDQAAMAEFAQDAELFGVLRPRDGETGTIKAISRSVALLVYSLQSPGPIPRHAVAGGDISIEDAVWRLTLDGVLEVERDGTFVSGASAMPASETSAPQSAVARVSNDALRLAATIPDEDTLLLANRLYFYNRRPLTPRWSRRIRAPGDVLRFAGASAGSPTAAALERHWKRKGLDVDQPWIHWWARVPARNPRFAEVADVTHKLYVSPQTETLPDVFPTLVEILADAGAPPFKIGASATEILRPDKLVVYFTRRTAANEVAAEIANRLPDVPAHPVPFTHAAAANGLVSIGMDPPAGRAMLNQVGASWRLWICRRLASYVANARQSGRAQDADRFALDRIKLDGIDPTTWEPSESALRGFAAEASA
jgi:hypothetical protein